MAYRPSLAGFERNAGSALAGVVPASLQASAFGTTLNLILVLAAALTEAGLSFDVQWLWMAPVIIFTLSVMMAIGTVFSALVITLIGVPVAWAVGNRLGSSLGLAVAAGAALVAGGALGIAFWRAPMFEDDGPLYGLMILAYALPAGLFYRRAVLAARTFSRFAEPSV
jgi:hypothetical protein